MPRIVNRLPGAGLHPRTGTSAWWRWHGAGAATAGTASCV